MPGKHYSDWRQEAPAWNETSFSLNTHIDTREECCDSAYLQYYFWPAVPATAPPPHHHPTHP